MQYRKLAAVLVILCVAACTSVKDEPLPLSRENIEKYAAAVGKSSGKLEPNAGSVIEQVDVLYRTPLENLLGYSFDRTLRHYFVHRAGITADPESRVFADLITPGAQAMRQPKTGNLAVGNLADIALLNQDGAHLFPRHDVLANLVYSARASDVDTVICNGKLLMLRGRLLTIDLNHVKAEITSRLSRLNQRVSEKRVATYSV